MTASNKNRTEDSHKVGLIPALAFSLGSMIGGGVFTLSGLVVDAAGSAAVIAYILAGVVMLLSALCFMAIASRSHSGDSGYAPLGAILGPAWRFLAMWCFYLSGVVAVAFLLVSFAGYLQAALLPGTAVVPLALAALAVLVLLNLGPADRVGRAETVMVAAKVAILLLLVGFGLVYLSRSHLTPFAPSGGRSLFQASALLFLAYGGFNVVTNMAGSIKNPNRTVPMAIGLSILICGAIYVGVVLALLASGQTNFGGSGLAKAAEALMGGWGSVLVSVAACVSTLSAANAMVLGSGELMIRLAAQGDIPTAVCISTRRGHPFLTVALSGAIAAVLIVVGRTGEIVALATSTAVLAMLVVDFAALRLAANGWKGPGMWLPGGVVLPVLAFGTAFIQLPLLGWRSTAIGAGMGAAGFVLFLLRHKRKQALALEAQLQRRIRSLETPLLRAVRGNERLPGSGRVRGEEGSGSKAAKTQDRELGCR